jgi:predicted 2-oxoglutarate/Fe(II)-dependent dioxygenase YbiX
MINLFDYVYIENLFSPQFCSDAIKKIDNSTFSPHTWYDVESGYVDTKDFMVTYCPELQKSMRENIFKFLLNYINVTKTSFALHESTEIRFNVYDSGCEMATHIDHIHSIFDGTKKGIPILSMVGLLNDDYDGGEFILCDKKIDLKCGDVIAFPSIFLYPHSVTKVNRGKRYSWVLWSF